ncbi:MAG: AAA family ATPase [Thermoanaerobaculia bacterium]|nr:AAA family ATPase [Thermoanaerobaculia bacterium]
MTAREKAGKSTLVRCGCAALTQGRPFLGSEVEPGSVLWVGEEHLGDVVRKSHRMGIDPDRLSILKPRSEDRLEELYQEAVRRSPDLIVIDTLSYLVLKEAPDSGNASHWALMLDRIRETAELSDAACLILTHSRKDAAEYRDSTAIGASVDMILTVKKEQATTRVIGVTGRYQLDDYKVDYDPEAERYAVVDTETKKDKVIRLSKEHPEMTAKEIADLVATETGKTCSDSYVRKHWNSE